jgi:hypothetical protein
LRELSVFADESGEFGSQSEYYVLTLVFHEQSDDISGALGRFSDALRAGGFDPAHAIHSGAAIRGEDEYRGQSLEARVKEFARLFAFAQHVPVTYKSFRFRKRQFSDLLELKGAISRALAVFLRDNAAYFLAFDRVLVFYDNGQAQITDVLNTLFNAFFFAVVFRKATPARYRLFQVADLYCTLELLRQKSADGRLTRSDLRFFGSRRALQKSYLAKLKKKEFKRPAR